MRQAWCLGLRAAIRVWSGTDEDKIRQVGISQRKPHEGPWTVKGQFGGECLPFSFMLLSSRKSTLGPRFIFFTSTPRLHELADTHVSLPLSNSTTNSTRRIPSLDTTIPPRRSVVRKCHSLYQNPTPRVHCHRHHRPPTSAKPHCGIFSEHQRPLQPCTMALILHRHQSCSPSTPKSTPSRPALGISRPASETRRSRLCEFCI